MRNRSLNIVQERRFKEEKMADQDSEDAEIYHEDDADDDDAALPSMSMSRTSLEIMSVQKSLRAVRSACEEESNEARTKVERDVHSEGGSKANDDDDASSSYDLDEHENDDSRDSTNPGAVAVFRTGNDLDDSTIQIGVEEPGHVSNLLTSLPLLEAQAVSEDVVEAETFDPSRAKRRQKILMLIALLFLVVGLIIGLVASGDGSSGTGDTSPAPGDTPTSDRSDRVETLADSLQVFFNEPLPSSDLQQEALSWLAYDDPANLLVMEADADVLLERFVLVLFNLARPPWHSSNLWLSEYSVCEWQGVGCNDNERVTSVESNKRVEIGTYVS